MIEAADGRFGGYDSVCIRTGGHGKETVVEATYEDCHYLYEGDFLQEFAASPHLLSPLIAQGSGQVVINTSETGKRPAITATLYSALHAGANMLVPSSALTVGQYGVTVNATGTYAMNYTSFLHDMGVDKDPAITIQIEDVLPLIALVEPDEAAYFVATLIDGRATAQTGQFFAVDTGWAEK